MSKFASNDVLDGSLIVASGATRMVALNGQPASFAAAEAGRLAEAALTVADFSFAAGDVSGRKVTVAAKAGLPVVAAGTADHIALLDATRLLYVTTCPAQALAPGGTVSIAAWAIEIGAPV
ncbi:hypothetical protein [Polymorphobacter fuscus]|uniref:DUF2190 family protein n=1 Tax=Sandarakinorhabdus fusca TaxID=1439888 RepID=A0A7C9GM34_9SPHN|nr:hypothetical protein [Polymorphobacter fuscus]KAB7648179.1 hypothetical protein F9290_00155 [Polymorphobacter fuscus]MQT15677.1 hypothetical protein [Polymorphobacter fuscus]NJC08052.1 hypothetical protein [Polymorphobacter fuscus]